MRYNITKNELEKIIFDCKSIADVCRLLDIRPVGGNYKTIKSKLLLWNIDFSHFTGQGWNIGRRFKPFNKKYPLSEILIENSTYTNSHRLKNRLMCEGLKSHKCEKCGINTWNGEIVPLELHHINGNNLDNRIENLSLLCPNCHSQTDFYRGNKKISEKNELKHSRYKESIRKNEPKYFCECGKMIQKGSKQCVDCYKKTQRKNERPSLEILLTDIKNYGFSSTGRKYGVSDNTIRKWIK